MKNNKTFVVVAKDLHFIEAVKIEAISTEDAIFRASKKMKADIVIFAKPVEELGNFSTDRYSFGTFKNYVCQLENGTVQIGHADIPEYTELPYKSLSVCWAINRLLKKESDYYPLCNHIIIGEKLPKTIISSSCYYCGESTTDTYF